MKKNLFIKQIIPILILAGTLTACIDDPDGGYGMVWIPPGTFIMGSNDKDASNNFIDLGAQPPHKVTLTQGFFISRYPITQDQYYSVMRGYDESISRPSYFDGTTGKEPANDEIQGRRPVENVSWYDAIVFCNKLSIRHGFKPVYSIYNSTDPDYWILIDGGIPNYSPSSWDDVKADWNANGYRLPTEAEWEYACRAGTTTAYNTGWDGTTVAAAPGWYWYNSDTDGSGEKTQEVGLKSPNAWGLYDMHGNVWEWCWDWYGDYNSQTTWTNPLGASSGSDRVIRGGSWNASAEHLRSAYRHHGGPSYRSDDMCFRVVRP